jgi:hypothetical protein
VLAAEMIDKDEFLLSTLAVFQQRLFSVIVSGDYWRSDGTTEVLRDESRLA